MTEKLWMILRNPDVINGRVEPKDRPSFVHDTLEAAEKEAERLALVHKESFLVLEGMKWVRPVAAELRGRPTLVPVYEELKR